MQEIPVAQILDANHVLATLIAFKKGDFSVRLPVNQVGLAGKIADVLNDIFELNENMAKELARVSAAVGKEGRIGQRAALAAGRGGWATCGESVNSLISDLVQPSTEIARVIGAVANGDLSQRMSLEVEGRSLEGEFIRTARVVNTMVDQLNSFASEVTRVAREVGTEGKLGGQAVVTGVAGTWKDLTDSVNSMASNLTNQVRNIAEVTSAVARGDLSRKVTVSVQGEILELKNTINTMVDQLGSFASEVTRVAREVGTEGKLGGQAMVTGVAGTWKDLTDSVNSMASNLTAQVRNIAEVTTAVARGDLSRQITVDVRGEILELKITINTMVDQLGSFASEVTRVAREVGTDGKLGGQAVVKGVGGVWKDLTDSVNFMAGNLTAQVRNIAEVTTAVANGELSRKITVDVRGEILELKNTINTMVDQLSSFASEVTRVAREVGTEGELGGQAEVKGVGGVWKDLTDSVNSMAGNLTAQVRNIAEVTTAVANGDLSRKITVDVRGEILELKNTINTMVDQLNAFSKEVTRVAREVGTEGELGGQAVVKGVGGVWKDLTDSVNFMAGNLTAQVRNIAEVTTAVANGDLSRKITVDVRGEILELKNTINTMVDQLSSFASEVTRVAREVGTEGKLGGQADVKGVGGVWKDLTDSVNSMARNLTNQVRNIAEVTTAVAKGDLGRTITVEVRGEILELKNTINTMVDQLSSFASEVTRVAREVGTEGKLGGQADVKGVAGTWRDLTESVNSMAGNLTAQVRNIAEVTTAVARGDLSRKITVDVRGEILELKNTINTMVDQLNGFASEVTRVAREVGTDGRLGGQADVKGVAGTWRDLTESVNSMASNLTAQVRNIADVTTAVAKGELSRKITVDARGEILALKDTINTMVDQLNSFASEVTRVAREVGTEGRLGGQADVYGVAGTWKDLTESVNSMASNLTNQVRNIAQVTTAVAMGDLSRKITVDVRGEILELKNTVNTMVDQLNSFASEVTRVAREVGTEGKLGGQAEVRGVAGTWKDLTDNVNLMAANLTTQVRGIAKVVTGVANGDLKRKLVLETKGEIAELAETINDMIDTLATFADQVTTVAREVGIEGKLGGQARVPGAAGIWRNLTDNVNQLAANLTTQVRSIAEVSTAVTKGDLTRSITVEAQGEVAKLKDNINEMIVNLAETTRKNTDQDWLKTNIAKFTRMIQGQRDLLTVAQLLLSELAPLVSAQHGSFYITETGRGNAVLKFMAGYACDRNDNLPGQFAFGQGLVGECARAKQRILVRDVPADYLKIRSSLGGSSPLTIAVLPVLFEGDVKAVVELGSFHQFSDVHMAFLDQLMESIGIVLNSIAATMRTEQLLEQSQKLAEELQKTNAELEEKAQLLAEQNTEVEGKNREIEQAKHALEEKAEQLALTSKYKSEFLANMSHELRTPLNNLLILARVLADNTEGNLSQKQIKFAETIHSSGTDLLALINDILDLSKIESGKMDVEVGNVRFAELEDYCIRTFRHVAEGKNIGLAISWDPELTSEILRTDVKRLQQVLKNLLSNALKFTEQGSVRLEMERAASGWSPSHPVLNRAKSVIAFSVVDTGIGIAQEKQRIIFEAFQQADGTTSRKYGGTGLGLSISRELARLLGGEIRLQSAIGRGSVFTLYLPQTYISSAPKLEAATALALPAPSDGRGEEVDLILSPSGATVPAGLVEELAVDDDRNVIEQGDRVLLIVEDDTTFARIMVDATRARGWRAIVALRAVTAISLAREYQPGSITLDVRLPDMSGWTLLDRLKHDPQTAHIPVHVISAHENNKRGFALGATTCIPKDANEESLEEIFAAIGGSMDAHPKTLLLIAENDVRRSDIRNLLAGQDLEVLDAADLAAASRLLASRPVDGIVLDWVLPEEAGIEFIEAVQAGRFSAPPDSAPPVRAGIPTVPRSDLRVPPVVVSGTTRLTEQQVTAIHRCARVGPVRYAPTVERLLEETTLLLHRPERLLSEEQRRVLAEVRQTDPMLAGRKVLVIDDDLRNIFALTSVLEHRGMKAVHAENGKAGIDLLYNTRDVDIVLLDIMMPEMDGYETMRAIRQIPEFQGLPIIALTAKAMKGDREKCLGAGASDYVAKPVDLDVLFSVMRVWMARDVDNRFEHGMASLPTWLEEHEVTLDDDRNQVQSGDAVLLIVEDDPTFAQVLVDAAHERGLKAVVALRGAVALNLACNFKPRAITLDVRLPDMSGWTVLDHLKHDPATRHIPVHVITGFDNPRDGFLLGAMTCVTKEPESVRQLLSVVQTSMQARKKTVLVIAGSEPMRREIREYLEASDLEVRDAASDPDAFAVLSSEGADGIVVDWVVSEACGVEFIEELQTRFQPFVPPVIVLGPPELDSGRAAQLHRLSRISGVRYAPTLERLLDETVLLLHRPEEMLSERQKNSLAGARQVDPMLAGRKILVVDDDLRNIFALTSVLEQHEIAVLHAETGRRGIDLLRKNPDVDLVLMDIMMPEMDGYETTRAIRKLPGFASLPIIALTAKAMKGDREKCLQAGASDYVTKPVDLGYLFSVMRVWLSGLRGAQEGVVARVL
jgi:HAMP domain-containing protein/CheY-like chemotaxis protein/signal transduction histidine kinase